MGGLVGRLASRGEQRVVKGAVLFGRGGHLCVIAEGTYDSMSAHTYSTYLLYDESLAEFREECLPRNFVWHISRASVQISIVVVAAVVAAFVAVGR